jgi:hypothetical protein
MITAVHDLLCMDMFAEKKYIAVLNGEQIVAKTVSTYCQTLQIKNLTAVKKINGSGHNCINIPLT